MSIFDLHSAVLADYRCFVRSFFTIADDRARQFVDRSLIDEARLWPDFLLQVSPSYPRTATVDQLSSRGELHEEVARIFRTPNLISPLRLAGLISPKLSLPSYRYSPPIKN